MSNEINALFEAVHTASSSSSWSRGVELARAGAVHGERDDGEEVVLRVATRGGLVSPTVRLFLNDEDWDCDCRTRATACEHVAASVIALRQARSEGQALPTPRRGAGSIGYRLTREDDGLSIERVIVTERGETPLTATLAALASGRIEGPEFIATAADLAVEQTLGSKRRGRIPRGILPRLVGQLGECHDIRLDGEPLDPDGPATYAERYIHAAIFEARPDVNSVIHNHAQELIPFTVTGVKLRPMSNTAGRIGAEIPLWDIREMFGDTNLLVVNIEQGRDLAKALDDKRMVLMRGHGCAIGAPHLHAAVTTAIYAQVNARQQMQAMQMGDVTYLSPGEIELMATSQHSATVGRDRSWEYLKNRAGCEHM